MLPEITDSGGNRLFFQGNEVYLQLRSEAKVRKIGEVVGDTLHTIRNLSKHEMHNQREVGFNYHLIKYGRFTKIVVDTLDNQEFRTTRRWVQKYGRCSKPGGQRYELQVFLKLSDFVGFVEPPEDPKPEPRRDEVQQTLFAQQKEVIT